MSLSTLRQSALAIFRAALAAAEPRAAVRRVLRREGDRLWVEGREIDLARIRRIRIVGFGKASAAMAQGVEDVLGDRIEGGVVTVKYGHVAPLKVVSLHEAGHPLPDANGLAGTERILGVLNEAEPEDWVICLISGGGSALLEQPVEGVTLDDLRVTTDALLRSGATINEMNALRKHLSRVKGGQLARRTRAPLLSLILSDVIGSPLDTIASGPTSPDGTTFRDAWQVIERRGVAARLPDSVVRHIERGVRGESPETPKADDPLFARVQNVVVADNAIACEAALYEAQAQGYHAQLLSTFVQGEAREVARVLVSLAREVAASGRPVARPACLVAGGETTVTVRGDGLGGRNQELALAAAIELAGSASEVVVLSAGTDGSDGPTDAAGAIAEGGTVARAAALGLDASAFLDRNDSYHFFQPLGDLIMTGPTNTNVNDVMLVMVG